MQLYTIPADIESDNTKRVYKKLDMHGNVLCHFEREPHPDDSEYTSCGGAPTALYYGQWVELTEEKITKDNKLQKANNGSNNAKATVSHIDLPMILRAVDPDEIAKFIERHKDQLEIITVDNIDDK